jgi:hypothetical protein
MAKGFRKHSPIKPVRVVPRRMTLGQALPIEVLDRIIGLFKHKGDYLRVDSNGEIVTNIQLDRK